MFPLTFNFNNYTDNSSLSSFSSSPSKTPVDVPWLLLKFLPPAFPGDLELEDGTEEVPELFDDIEIIIKDGDVGEICEAFYFFFIDRAVQNCFGERTEERYTVKKIPGAGLGYFHGKILLSRNKHN